MGTPLVSAIFAQGGGVLKRESLDLENTFISFDFRVKYIFLN